MRKVGFLFLLSVCVFSLNAQNVNRNVLVTGTEWVQRTNTIDMRSDNPSVSESSNKIKFTDGSHVTITLFGGWMVIVGTYSVEGNIIKVVYSDGGTDEWRIEGDTLYFDNDATYTRVTE